MVVITGPFSFLTTSRSGESGTDGTTGSLAGVVAAFFDVVEGAGVQPGAAATTAARALRIMKARRSEPVGTSLRTSSPKPAPRESLPSFLFSEPSELRF